MSDQRHFLATTRIRECESVVRTALAEQSGWIAEISRTGSYAENGASMRVWLRELLNLGKSDAKTRVLVAESVHPHMAASGAPVDAERPVIGQAVRTGSVTLDHARSVIEGVRALPSAVPESTRANAESWLTESARQFSPREVRTLAERIRYLADQDGASREEEYQYEHRKLHLGTGRDGMTVLNGRFDREAGARVRAVLDSLSAPRATAGDDSDRRDSGQRYADALVTTMRFAADNVRVPRQGGTPPQLTVTIDYSELWQQLANASSGGTVDRTGQPITAVQARRLACDAEILPMVLDGTGVPLDVGRTRRTAPAPLRAALLARDETCAFPGCDRPPETPEAHHVLAWWDGRRTALDNLVMLCAHHRVVHSHGWGITISDGRPLFTPPEWIDPTRQPRRGGEPQHRTGLAALVARQDTGDQCSDPVRHGGGDNGKTSRESAKSHPLSTRRQKTNSAPTTPSTRHATSERTTIPGEHHDSDNIEAPRSLVRRYYRFPAGQSTQRDTSVARRRPHDTLQRLAQAAMYCGRRFAVWSLHHHGWWYQDRPPVPRVVDPTRSPSPTSRPRTSSR